MSKVNSRKFNNKGVSFIEMIVVIAIMTILIGFAIIGFGIIQSGNAKKAVKSVASEISELRTDTLSVNSVWTAKIFKDGDETVMAIFKDGTENSRVKLGSRVTVSIRKKSEGVGSDRKVDSGNDITMSFAKGTGKFLNIQYGSAAELLNENCVLTVEGGNKTYSMDLWFETGRITNDY